MKRLYALLSVLFIPLFLFTPKVEADEMTITYNDYSLVSSDCFTDVLDDASSRFSYFLIYYLNNTSSYYVYVPRTNYNMTMSRSFANLRLIDSNGYDYYQSDSDCSLPDYSSGYNGAFSMNIYNNWSTSEPYLLYSNIPLNVTGSYQIDTTDGTTLITCSVGTTCPSATMYYWYSSYPPTPPEPTDDTPLLTSFVTITIDRLNYICSFITSSYIYLSIFVVFILMFVILLIRRLR